MSVNTLEIIQPGLLTTVQDRGRHGYQRFGVPVSGALDMFALRAANILAGNDEGAACLEMTALGPRIKFLADTWVALAGADLSPTLDGTSLPMWQGVKVSRDSILTCQAARTGMRAYLAVAGGIDVPVVMGSRSTYLKGAMGGFEGRALKAGDVLGALAPGPGARPAGRRLPESMVLPSYGHEHQIRIILGPQDQAFTPAGIATFLGSRYILSNQSDRMGYRLDGPTIERVSGSDIVSDGSPLGAVQVPGDGRPIILLADRGTTGGYTKIATVIGVDVGKLGQVTPGDTVTFKAVSLEEAHAALRGQEELLKSILGGSGEAARAGRPSVIVEGRAFEVIDETGTAITSTEEDVAPGSRRKDRLRATVDGHTFEFEVEVQESN